MRIVAAILLLNLVPTKIYELEESLTDKIKILRFFSSYINLLYLRDKFYKRKQFTKKNKNKNKLHNLFFLVKKGLFSVGSLTSCYMTTMSNTTYITQALLELLLKLLFFE